jgi:hypothetical protein
MPNSITWKKLVKKFRALGFDGPYPGGRHLFMIKGAKGDISKSLISELLRQAGISSKDWNNL